ncbi:PASTA domain-containing protein [Micromonospora costi]|uniref:PASTA domain-containing protein n=1 Tax=Micromonospora costi TaxID=1530042 RepID=A0A3A9ZVS0_9ACTN|nr:PASTA domain-containing protein [Micromonospora costi]RKN51377.1 PASTA domain-containing protein [Micromonospora costi]
MSDDHQEPTPGDHEGDETRPLPRPDAEPAELTRRLPGPADRGGPPPAGPTPSDATAADRTAALPPERPWSGRAEVPPPRSSDYREPSGEWYAEDQGGRRWWLPILWGVLALLLLALLGTALWLLSNVDDGDRTGPDPTPSASVASSAAPTSAAPTSAEPTTEPPSSAPPTTEAASVPVPPLAGLPQETAEALLDRWGLSHRVEYRPSELPPGTVIGTEPGAGEPVTEDGEVVLLVSEADPSASPSAVTPSPTATGTP